MEKDVSTPTGPTGNATGLIIGKFMPPHRGHQYLIDFARERVAHLIVLVCSLPHEPIPGHLRCAWVRELYPNVDVRHVTDENPSYPHEHPGFWHIWTRTIRREVPTGPDVVFTSEDYGDELARRLGARHVACDQARQIVPVSASQIRADPLGHWEFLPECVRPYYVRRVAIVGPESTGKTTLAQQLAAHYGTVWVPEFARAYLDQKSAACTAEDIAAIARGQNETEDALARRANRVLFCDTDLITTTIWSHHYFGSCPDWIEAAASARRYDLYLLTDIDIPWISDPQRDCGHLRERFRDLFRGALEARGRAFTPIFGSFEARLHRAVQAVDEMLQRNGPPPP